MRSSWLRCGLLGVEFISILFFGANTASKQAVSDGFFFQVGKRTLVGFHKISTSQISGCHKFGWEPEFGSKSPHRKQRLKSLVFATSWVRPGLKWQIPNTKALKAESEPVSTLRRLNGFQGFLGDRSGSCQQRLKARIRALGPSANKSHFFGQS